MSRKLGEILVAGKSLEPADLKRALDAQLIFGGRLGTNLLELGFLDEDTLAHALTEQKRIGVASQEMFENASAEALRLVPAKIADRHKIIPLELKDKKLRVAMLDPTDLIVLDELSFITGCAVIPMIAPEVRLLAFLERYYKIPRPLRYIKLAQMDEDESRPRRLDTESLAATYTQGLVDSRPGAPSAPGPPRPLGERPLSAEQVSPEGEQVLSLSDLLDGASQPAAAAPAPPASAPAPATSPLPAGGDPLLEQARRLKEQDERAAPAARPEPEPVATLEDAARALAEADSREEIGDALLGFAGRQFARTMTFVLQKERALGWMAALAGQDAARARQAARSVVIPLDQPSVLQSVAESGQYYLGELPARPADEALAAALGAPRPVNLVILPVKLNDKAILAVLGDNAGQPLSNFDMRGLRSLCQKAAQAMEVLLIRSQIRQV